MRNRSALGRRWYLMVLVIIIAGGAAVGALKSVKNAPTGDATSQILVDSPVSQLVNLKGNTLGLEDRASVLAQAMTSNAVVAAIAKADGVPAGDVTAQGPYSGTGEVLDVPTPSEARGMQLVSAKPQYHLTFVAQQDLPIITVSVLGPNPEAAGKMANAVLPGTEAWLATLATASGQPQSGNTVILRQLGAAQAGYVNSSTGKIIAGVAAIGVLILGTLLVMLFDRLLVGRREPDTVGGARVLGGEARPRDREQLPPPVPIGGQQLEETTEPKEKGARRGDDSSSGAPRKVSMDDGDEDLVTPGTAELRR